VTYWLKIANFSPSHLAPMLGFYFFRIYGKASQILKLESSRQPMVKIWWS